MTPGAEASLQARSARDEDRGALIERAWLLQYGNPQQARLLAAQVVEIARAAGDEVSEAYGRLTIACYEMRHGDREFAAAEFRALKQFFLPRDDKRGQLRSSFGLSVLLSRSGDSAAAYTELVGYLPDLDQALMIDAFMCYNSLGAISADVGQVDDCLRYFYKALGCAREMGSHDHLALILSNLGSTQHEAGNYEDAIRFLVEAYDLLPQSGMASLGPLVAGNLAMCQLAIGAHQAAYETIRPFLDLADDSVHIGAADGAFFQAIAAHTYTVHGEWAAARASIDKALESALRSGEVRVLTHCHWVSGLVERAQGHLGESLAALQRAEENLPKLQDPYYPVQIYRELSRAHAALEQWKLAYEYLEKYQQLYQRSQGSAARARTQIMQIQSELVETERERDFALMKQAEAERARGELESLNQELAIKVDEIQQLQGKLREQAIRDPLTELYNRRYLQEELANEIKVAERRFYPVSVVLIDLDHFKQVNDRFGHPVGDKVLIELADLMRANIRGSDFACRYGGEEFCLVLSDIPLDNAVNRIRDLLEKFRQVVINVRGKTLQNLTFSAGIAVYPQHGRTSAALLKAADKALYRAKAAGRDRIFEAD